MGSLVEGAPFEMEGAPFEVGGMEDSPFDEREVMRLRVGRWS